MIIGQQISGTKLNGLFTIKITVTSFWNLEEITFFIEFFKRKHWIRRCLVAVSGLILVYQIENSILLQIIAFLPFAMLIVVMEVACRKRVQ